MTRDQASASYHRGLAELDNYLLWLDDTALPCAIDAFRSAAALAPDDPACWTALGWALDAADLADDALAALREAARLDPDDHDVEVFVLTLLSESGAEPEALAGIQLAAEHAGVDLESVRQSLTRTGVPVDSRTLLLDAFIRPRNFVKSRLEDEIERAERRKDPAEWMRRQAAVELECSEAQAELQREVDPERVPSAFRSLTGWAGRLGMGDDFCRELMAGRLTEEERAEVVRTVGEHASIIQDWIDSFEPGTWSVEAAAFMYLLLSAEEMDAGR